MFAGGDADTEFEGFGGGMGNVLSVEGLVGSLVASDESAGVITEVSLGVLLGRLSDCTSGSAVVVLSTVTVAETSVWNMIVCVPIRSAAPGNVTSLEPPVVEAA